jgi:hypothetical protein
MRNFALIVAAAMLSLSPLLASAAAKGDVAQCAQIADATARLACYDGLAHRPADAAPSAPPVLAPAPAPAASAAKTNLPAPAQPVTVAPDDPKNFGLSQVQQQQHVKPAGPKSEKATITSLSSDGQGLSWVELDNGQTWKVLDNDGRLSSGDQVVIKPASLASFLMTAPSGHKYRVHRTR